MITKKEIIFTFVLAINLFLLSFFFSKSWTEETCCPFKSYRSYGFPLTILFISKTSQDSAEAQKIYYSKNHELLSQGWDLQLGSDSINFPLALLVNFLFYLLASGIFVGLFNSFIFMLTKRIRKEEYRRSY